MKKKSSSGLMSLGVLAFFSLVVILSYLMRTVSIPSTYGAVDVDIPVMEMALELAAKPPLTRKDAYFPGGLTPSYEMPESSSAKAKPLDRHPSPHQPLTLDDSSPMVFVGEDTVYFGRLTAFTSKLTATHNKFSYDTRKDQSYASFAKTFSQWQAKASGLTKGVVVVLPARSVAMDKVIHLIAALKDRPDVQRVVLGGGLL